jgi:type VI secretion system secreted protein VgrG
MMGSMIQPTQAYCLTLARQPAPFSVLQFSGREEISRPYRFEIEFTSPSAAIPAREVLGRAGKLAIEVIEAGAPLSADVSAPPRRLSTAS